MTPPTKTEQVCTWCAELPAAVLEFPFGDDAAVYKVGGKMFALATVAEDPGYITLKVDPEDSIVLRDRYDFVREGYYMNKRHWVTIDLVPEVPMDEVHELIGESYLLVIGSLTKKARVGIGIELP